LRPRVPRCSRARGSRSQWVPEARRNTSSKNLSITAPPSSRRVRSERPVQARLEPVVLQPAAELSRVGSPQRQVRPQLHVHPRLHHRHATLPPCPYSATHPPRSRKASLFTRTWARRHACGVDAVKPANCSSRHAEEAQDLAALSGRHSETSRVVPGQDGAVRAAVLIGNSEFICA